MVITSDITISPFSTPVEERSNIRQALPQILAVCVKNVLLLGFGMTLGFPTILIPSLSGNNPDEPFHLGYEEISWIGSINLICVPVGCLLSGVLTQPIGRKRAMQLVNLPFLTAWLLFYFSTKIWHVYVALCLTGFSGGLLEAPVLTYVAEITQPYLRGILSSTSSMSVILGVLNQFLLGTFLSWRTVVLVNCTIPILSFILLNFVPETPMWLISKNRYLDARKSIAWLRGWTSLGEIELEFQDLCKQLGKADDIGIDNPKNPKKINDKEIISSKEKKKCLSKLEYLKLFKKKNFIWPFILVAYTFFLGHFNGMTTIQTYAVNIFATLKTPIDKYFATVLLGTVELLGCIVCVTLVNFIGKRRINFISLIGSGICLLLVGVYTYMDKVKFIEQIPDDIPKNLKYIWVPTTLIIASAFLSHIGIKILPWILTGEVFSNETRATASGISAATGYIFGFISNKIFLSMTSTFTLAGTFWFYAGVSFTGTIILYFALPETEGKSLYDITQHFNGTSKLNNKVHRRQKHGHSNEAFVLEHEEHDKTLTYVAEITQPSLRGILASTSTIAIITGILIQFLLGTFYHWKIVSLISIIVPFISFTLLFLVPESPHWLISKNRLTDGQKSLAWLRGWSTIDNQVENEFKDLCNQLLSHSKDNLKSNKMKNIHLFKKKNFLWPFGLVSFTFFLGHFSGMTTLQSYGVIIFSTFHTPIDYYYLTIILGVAQVFGCILSASLVHFVGKRPMNFFSLFGCGGSFLLAATYAYIYNINHFNMEIKLDVDYIWIPIVFLISAGFCTHAGIRILPWMLIGEVFPHEIRSTSSGLCGGLSYIFGFAANKLFLTMVAKLTLWGTFYIYSIVAFLGLFILYFALPETEGKTLFQITEYFKGGPKLERCVGNSKSSIYIGHDNKGFESYKDIRESKM